MEEEVLADGLTLGDWLLAVAVLVGGIALGRLARRPSSPTRWASTLLQLRHPFRRGDEIRTNDHEGRVVDVNFRTVVPVSPDGERIYIPSSDLPIRFWHAATIADMWRVRSAVAVATKPTLDEAGAAIPFPQRVVSWRDGEDPAA